MSYQYPPPNQPPYGAYGHPQQPPHGYQQPPYPQQPAYGAPPPQGHYPPPQHHGHYAQPPPPQGGHYGAPSPQPPYGAPSPQPPYGQPPPSHAPYGHHPPPSQPHGYAPPPQQPPAGAHGYPPPGAYGAPPPMASGPPPGAPSMPSLGYAPGQTAPGDFRREADALRKAMKGFGTDEKALIQVLARLDPLQMAAVRATYAQHIGRDLYKDVKSETGGYFRDGLLAVIDGPLQHDVACAHEAIEGIGTKEWLLNDVLLGRSNADLAAIKAAYERTYRRALATDVEGDLSFQTAALFAAVVRAARHEESVPVNPQAAEAEARALHDATAARMRNNVAEVCGVFARSSDAELRAIDHAFHARYHASLEKHLEKEFSGHMEVALVQMLRSATDPAMRDAILLEECMAGMGTKDERLVVRVVRVHWNRNHKEMVKRAYRHRYHKDLIERVRGETSGDYQRLMVALLE
ncbi:uncharacterized protein N7459_001445 [Penicillium hispanicum]|uniref:uncharacterized protein n=1 Tax=Penicillium hispanicum TaxID=1080232 RepID=UPI0025402CA3|nr:uncharacterized protein N7459_001445 [Penicillium hispanicum]KAJ5595237.1 hypothetical protein N7459_001445 [Penicillium hispanicum]